MSTQTGSKRGAWPDAEGERAKKLTTRELMMILEGIDHRDVRFRKRMNRVPA